MRILLCRLSWVLLAFGGCSQSSDVTVSTLPDLVISHVAYARLPSIGTYLTGPSFQFTLTIRNIGDADFHVPFYISSTHNAKTYEDQFCGHTQLVNKPVTVILPGDSIEVNVLALIEGNTPDVLFVINTNDLYAKGVHLLIIPEVRYDNNSYVLHLQW